MLKAFRTFQGGFKFKRYIGQPKPVMVDNPIPEKVIIPLRQGFGTEVKPLVKIGDAVFAGQVIARDDHSISSPVHSSVNGIVEEIKRMNYFKRDINMVVIRTTNPSLGIPTRFKSSIISPDEVKHLIIHGVGSEPYNLSLEQLLEGKNLLHLFEGVKILKRIMPNCRVHLAINAHKRKIIEQLGKLSSQLEWLDIYLLEPK